MAFEGNKAVNINEGTNQSIYVSLDSYRLVASQETLDPTAINDNVIVKFPAFYVIEPFVDGFSENEGAYVTW